MRILVIGGTGVISTPFVALAAAEGHRVTVLNRGHTAVRVPDRALPFNVELILADRYHAGEFADAVATAGTFDVIVDMITFSPEQATGLVHAVRGRCGQLVFCSTVDVYDKPPRRYPIPDDAPRGGLGQYATDKTQCEAILGDAEARGEINLTVLRPAHTYGDQGAVIHSLGFGTEFLDRLRRGKPVIVHGDGQSLWASCRAEDVAQGFVGALGNAATFGRGYTLASPEWLTWRDYIRQLAAAMDAPEPTIVPIPTETLMRAVPDRARIAQDNFQFDNVFEISAAQRDLGFAPRIGFAEGMRRTVRWLTDHDAIRNSDLDSSYDQLVSTWHEAEVQFGQKFAHEQPERGSYQCH